MATLVIQEIEHFHDVEVLVLTTSLVDLVIAESDHLHYVDALGNITNKHLAVAEAWHDHVSGHVLLPSITLEVAEAYHVHAGDSFIVSAHFLWTDPFDPPKLPALELSAQGETFLKGRSGGSKLPVPRLSIRAGARMDSSFLPDFGITATGSGDTLGSLNRRMAGLQVSARGGARADSLKLPVLELAIAVTGDLIGRLDRQMPGLTISATGISDTIGTLSRRIPTLRLTSASMSWSTTGTLSKSMPGLKLSASMSLNAYGTLARDIPTLQVSATGHRSSIDVSLTMPAFIMAAVGAGSSQGGTSPSVIKNTSRFTDYVLRYSR